MRASRRTIVEADKLTKRETEMLALVKADPGKGRVMYAKPMGISPNTASAYLDALQAAGLIHVRGFGRYSTWWPGQQVQPFEMARTKAVNSVWAMA